MVQLVDDIQKSRKMNSLVIKLCFSNVRLKTEDAECKNFSATCKHCPNKRVSGNVSSSTNFLRHIKVITKVVNTLNLEGCPILPP